MSDFPISLATWILSGGAVFAAYVIHGITGFGAPLLSVPVLAHSLPVAHIIPMQAVLDLAAGYLLGQRLHKQFDRTEFAQLAIPMLFGMILGATLLVALPQRVTLAFLGISAVAFGLIGLFGRVRVPPLPRWAAIPFGLVGGVLSTLFGAGGPVYVMYIAGRIRDATALRATIVMFAVTSAVLRVGIFVASGALLSGTSWKLVAAFTPFMVAGVLVGHRLHGKLSAHVNRSLVYLLLVIAGTSLLVRFLY